MADESLQILIQIRDKLDGLDQTKRGLREASQEAKGLGNSLQVAWGTFSGNIASRAVSMGIQQTKRLVAAGFEYQANLEQQELRFRRLTGSMENARALMRELQDLADRSPFREQQWRDATETLHGFGGEALANTRFLEAMGDAAAHNAIPIDRLSEIIGRMYLRLESGDEIGTAITDLRRLGVVSAETIAELREASSAGDAVQILQRHWASMSGSMEEQANSVNGQLSRLWDNLGRAAGALVGSNVDDMTKALKELNEWLSSDELLDSLRGIGELMRDAIELAVKLKGAVTPTNPTSWDDFRRQAAPDGLPEPTNAFQRLVQRATPKPNFQVDMGVIEKAPGAPASADPPAPFVAPPADLENIRLAQRHLELTRIRADMAKLESDQLITQQGKLGQRLELLGREAEILPEISKAYTDIGNAMWEKGDHLEAIEMWERATELSATLVENLNEIDGITHSFEAGITAWVDGFGTVEDRATNLFTTTLNPLAQNFGQTMLSEFRKGGDALDVVGNIGMQMFDAFITNAINYGMQWLITQGLIKTGLLSTKALGTTIRAAETTETIAAEGAKTPILTTNAGLAAAGSFGASAIIGIAALVAAMAALGGFMQGGYTGGRRNETRGVVHGEEYVFDADTVRAIGLAPLEQMHATQSLPMLPVPVGGGGSDGGGSSMMAAREDPMVKHTTVNMHPGQRRRKVLDDPNTRYELREWLREDYGL